MAGDIPATRLYEDEHVLAFADTNPQAPTHLLVIPKLHFADLPAISGMPRSRPAISPASAALAEQQGLTDFRTSSTPARASGQTVFHVHAHVLAGRPMGWPPG